MREQPGYAGLLAAARNVLLETLLPHLPQSRRYDALMVANAMAIAMRDAAIPPSDEAEILDRLRGLTPDRAKSERAVLAVLSLMVRDGRLDPGTDRHGEAMDGLRDLARFRAAISNPKVLGR